ncbi:hypothetical protein Aperf_G00000080816 [Anoplocephala perfoliata]
MPTEIRGSDKPELVTIDVLQAENETETSIMLTNETETSTLHPLTSSEVGFTDDNQSEEYKDEILMEVHGNKTDGNVTPIYSATGSTDDILGESRSSNKSGHLETLDFSEASAIGDSTTENINEVSGTAITQFEMDEHENRIPHSTDKDSEKATEENTEAYEDLLNTPAEHPLSSYIDQEPSVIGEGNAKMSGKSQIILEEYGETNLVITASNSGDDQGIFETETTEGALANDQRNRLGKRLDTLKGSLNHSFRTVKNDILKAAESLNNAVESLGSALENFVEKLRDDLPKYTVAEKLRVGTYQVNANPEVTNKV